MNEFLDLRCDIDEPASIGHVKPKMFSERFHFGKGDSAASSRVRLAAEIGRQEQAF
jgi:hypothetical protein